MPPFLRRALAVGRRLLIFTVVGFACGAVLGVLYVVVGWFPGAMATYAENPQFVDPRRLVWGWSAAWAISLGLLGGLIGLGMGALVAATESSQR